MQMNNPVLLSSIKKLRFCFIVTYAYCQRTNNFSIRCWHYHKLHRRICLLQHFSSRKVKIYTVDARNHGESPHTPEHNSAYMAVDSIELMRKQGMAKACVMGHSMGGRAMMHLTLKHPELIDRAIIVDISPIALPRDFQTMENIFKAMANINIPAKHSLGQGRKIAEEQIKEAVGNQSTVEFILMNLKKRDNGEFYWIPNVESLYNNLRFFDDFLDHIKYLPPFKGPVMFICGNKSNFVDPESWPQIQQMFPKAELHWLNAGHLVHFEQPQKFINLVVQFLKR